MFKKIEKFIEYFIFILLSSMSILIFLQVIFRYIIKYSLPWSEELARYLFVWFALLGAAAGVKKNAHFGVDILVRKLKPKFQKKLYIISSLFILFFLSVIIFKGTNLTINNWTQLSPAMRIPMSFPYAAVPVSSVLMCIYIVKNIITHFKNQSIKIE
ncbi:TRAP transporter small permease [candidate division KSB1 bacterium]